MPTPARLALLLAVLGTPYCVPAAPAGDWPRFRGPNGTGAADATAPVSWTDTENLLWKVPVPGVGHSSPIVVKGRVFLESCSDDASRRMLLCFDAATGKPLWTKEAPGHTAGQIIHKKNSLASSTPASDGERVFALFWDGRTVTLHAYDLDGNELWHQSLGGYASQHGVGLSPVAHAGKVFVNYDQDRPDLATAKDKAGRPLPKQTLSPEQRAWAEVLAFDAKTGALAWRAERKAFRACSSSPLVRELPGGKSEIVIASTAGITGYDPDTGKVNWDWPWKFEVKPLRNVGSPILAGGAVVAISGDGDGTRSAVAVSPGPPPKELWRLARETPYVPCPVVKGDYLFWIADDGHAVCADAKTGKQVWRQRAFNASVTASPLLIGDAVLAIADNGKAVAFKASPGGFEELATSDVGESVTASPAAADGRLYIRGAKHLLCVGKK